MLFVLTVRDPGEPAWSVPDPNRPVVDLSYDVAADLHSATGELHIEFHPDLPVCELDAWADAACVMAALRVQGVLFMRHLSGRHGRRAR